jgi:hypothetical protein
MAVRRAGASIVHESFFRRRLAVDLSMSEGFVELTQ